MPDQILADKLRQIRKQNRYSQEEVAKHLGISRRSYGLYELNKTHPDADKILAISDLFNVSTDWLLTKNSALTKATPNAEEKAMPLLGLASCSVEGWYTPELKKDMTAPVLGRDIDDGFAVIATGPSLIPEGIKPKFMCYCTQNTPPISGDVIYIKEYSGQASMKVFREKTPEWLVIEGYFPPDGNGVQKKYTEKRALTQVEFIAPVVYVRRK